LPAAAVALQFVPTQERYEEMKVLERQMHVVLVIGHPLPPMAVSAQFSYTIRLDVTMRYWT